MEAAPGADVTPTVGARRLFGYTAAEVSGQPQGYHLARPMAGDALDDLVAESHHWLID
jgi:hypothetical protein